ncbi:Na+/H+ antiporter subunit C [Ancylobacter vacuolatus]|uniref:Multicomponent K+:H+ antiporter subunit C n=1 Tax=Ancylobacter vacuolatus TaxID=223389 RepID=A0ABU0DIX6_9HYPH|nr:Na+/H+ antiporter subunit C [Ancylobacter vacuolatus]MDQ0348378.1 multicomponent K+:H+ antiporter subunit C [Ancylobacter vacuolatus]
MEIVLAIGIGLFTASGVWLLLRPRTYQVIIGLALLSYAVNLFIFAMAGGGLRVDSPPILAPGGVGDPTAIADPIPQALVLTAIVIGFAMTALFLVVLLAARGRTGTDHVDGREPDR